jgi:hypothetical protein
MSLQKNIKDLIFFYVKQNYENYLKVNNVEYISEDKITEVISSLYLERKDHLKEFIKTSLKQVMKEEYPGDLVILNIMIDIFSDDELCKNRLIVEIKLHQQKMTGGKNDYSKLLS